MKTLTAIFILGFCLAQSSMTARESDRKHEGFVGEVKTATTYLSAISGNWQSTPRGKQCKFRTVMYDSTGRLIQSSLFSECGRGGEFQDTFTYDKDGNRYDKYEMIGVRSGIPSGPPPMAGKPIPEGEAMKTPSATFKYDDQGKRTEQTGLFSDGRIRHKFVYKYDGQGRLYELLRFFPDEKSPDKTVYAYQADQRFPSGWTSYRADGSLSEKYSFSNYEFNSMGDWIKRKAVIEDGTGKRTGWESCQIEYYLSKK